MVLPADNTYTGTTTISAGTLVIDGNQPGSAVVLDGGTLGVAARSAASLPTAAPCPRRQPRHAHRRRRPRPRRERHAVRRLIADADPILDGFIYGGTAVVSNAVKTAIEAAINDNKTTNGET